MIADQAYYYHAEPAASRMGGVRPHVGLGLFENLGEIRQNKSLDRLNHHVPKGQFHPVFDAFWAKPFGRAAPCCTRWVSLAGSCHRWAAWWNWELPREGNMVLVIPTFI
jgi:hypothetical protein